MNQQLLPVSKNTEFLSTSADPAVPCSWTAYFAAVGKIERVCCIRPWLGLPFTSCFITVLYGEPCSTKRVPIEARIVGEEVLSWFDVIQCDLERNKAVNVQFVLNNVTVSEFKDSRGKNRPCLKGDLFKLGWVKSDEAVIYLSPDFSVVNV